MPPVFLCHYYCLCEATRSGGADSWRAAVGELCESAAATIYAIAAITVCAKQQEVVAQIPFRR